MGVVVLEEFVDFDEMGVLEVAGVGFEDDG